jgi:SHS2 domain-containing protein
MSETVQGSYRFIDHTADVGILINAPTVEFLFEMAALALTELITSVDTLTPRIERRFKLREDEIETLLVSWLQELLYLLDTEGLVFGRYKVNLQGSRLEATAWGESFDPEVHPMKTEIKAVTYHQLEVVERDEGWHARVIVDL